MATFRSAARITIRGDPVDRRRDGRLQWRPVRSRARLDQNCEPAPVHYAAEDGIAGQYIVVFREAASTFRPGSHRRLVDQHGGELSSSTRPRSTASPRRLPEQALQGIRRNPHVALIEQDVEVFHRQTVQSNAPGVWTASTSGRCR
jgi:hypothetical protein